MFQYKPVKQFLRSSDLGDYRSYGIHGFSTTSSGCTEVCFISDVSCDLAYVSHLTESCTLLQLDPVHIMDVVLDTMP